MMLFSPVGRAIHLSLGRALAARWNLQIKDLMRV